MGSHEWTEEYRSAKARVHVTLRFERSMGDTDTDMILRSSRGGTYKEGNPVIAGMAVSRDGTRLYIQRCRRRERQRSTIDLRTGKKVEGVPHPSSWSDIILLTDFMPAKGDGYVYACCPPFELTELPFPRAASFTDDERMAHLESVVGQSPSPEGWLMLAALFQHWTGPALARGLALAERGLSRWPAAVRRKPLWLRWYEAHAIWRLVRERPKDLEISGEPVGDEGARQLASSPLLDKLERLALRRCGVGPAGADAISSSRHLQYVRALGLERNPIGDVGALTIATSPYLDPLIELDLRRCSIGPEGARALARSHNLRNVRKLRLSGNGIGDDGLAELARAPWLPKLEELELDRCDIHTGGIAALANARSLRNMRRLLVVGNPIGEQGLALLERSPALRNPGRTYGGRCAVKHDVGAPGSRRTLRIGGRRARSAESGD